MPAPALSCTQSTEPLAWPAWKTAAVELSIMADSAAQFLAEGGRKLERWQQMQAHTLNALWNNEDDEIWNDL